MIAADLQDEAGAREDAEGGTRFRGVYDGPQRRIAYYQLMADNHGIRVQQGLCLEDLEKHRVSAAFRSRCVHFEFSAL